MWSKTLLLVLHIFYLPSFADKVYWLPNKSIYLATNFENGMLPCSRQTIVFPESVEESIIISDLSVSGLILPLDGEIILEEGGLKFGSDDEDNCTRVGNTYYKDDQISSWAQPDAWSSARFNKATPDAERVPCYNDVAVFPQNGQFAIKLPERPQAVQFITTDANVVLNIQELTQMHTRDQSQQFIVMREGMLRTAMDNQEHVLPCLATTHECPCQTYALDIDCKQKFCPTPGCSHPIKPVGHCCELCGASLLIEITKHFNMQQFKESVKSVVESYGVENLVYHVGLLPKQYGIQFVGTPERVQVVVMDKGEYTGMCKQVVADINHMLSEDWVQSNMLLYSGNPSSESAQGGKITVTVFFLVVITMIGLFAYYYEWSLADLRDLRGGMARNMLSRIQRRSDSVISLARRDSTVSTATLNPGRGTSFRNPMYSSIRDRVQVEAISNAE